MASDFEKPNKVHTLYEYEIEDKTLIVNGAITKIHGCSPKWLVLLNELFPMSIDIIDLKGEAK